MHRDVRELVKKAESLGFVVAPELSGGGHVVLVHDNGMYTCPSTPSDHRWSRNALAAMERIAGRKLPRPNHHRGRKRKAADTQLEAARRKHAARADAQAAAKAQQAAEDQAREAAWRAAEASDRREREIRALMRGGT